MEHATKLIKSWPFVEMMRVRPCLIVAIMSNLFMLLLKTMKEFLVIWRLSQYFLVVQSNTEQYN